MEGVRMEVSVIAQDNCLDQTDLQGVLAGSDGLFCVCVCSGIELDKLDAEMIKLLAWQRIQQLFPPKAASTPPPVTATVAAAPKSSSPQPDSETFVNHTFSFVCFQLMNYYH